MLTAIDFFKKHSIINFKKVINSCINSQKVIPIISGLYIAKCFFSLIKEALSRKGMSEFLISSHIIFLKSNSLRRSL